MDRRLSVLTAFPPAAGIDNEEYYKESQQHAKRVRELIKDNAQWIRESADDILKVHSTSPNRDCPLYKVVVHTADPVASAQHVNPAVHSLSYLMILDYLLQASGRASQQAHESLASYMTEFFLQFDARQIRCTGSIWSDILKEVYNEHSVFPVGSLYFSPRGSHC